MAKDHIFLFFFFMTLHPQGVSIVQSFTASLCVFRWATFATLFPQVLHGALFPPFDVETSHICHVIIWERDTFANLVLPFYSPPPPPSYGDRGKFVSLTVFTSISSPQARSWNWINHLDVQSPHISPEMDFTKNMRRNTRSELSYLFVCQPLLGLQHCKESLQIKSINFSIWFITAT